MPRFLFVTQTVSQPRYAVEAADLPTAVQQYQSLRERGEWPDSKEVELED
jgi:hypothetical protein